MPDRAPMIHDIHHVSLVVADTARALAAIDGARLVHLHHNKHELTWLWGFDGAGGA